MAAILTPVDGGFSSLWMAMRNLSTPVDRKSYSALQSQKTVAAYLESKLVLPFDISRLWYNISYLSELPPDSDISMHLLKKTYVFELLYIIFRQLWR